MKSKVKFVSAVGVRLLPSFWACPWFSLSSRSYCVTLAGGGSPLLVVKCIHLALQVFPAPACGGGVSSIFPFRWLGKEGGSVWATIIPGAQFLAHTLSAVCAPHSPLCAVAPDWRGLATLLCTPLISPWGALSGSKSCPQSSLFVGGATGRTRSLPSAPQLPFRRSLFGRCCCSEPLPHFLPTPTLWQVPRLSQTQPVVAHLFSQCQVPPESPPLSDKHCPGWGVCLHPFPARLRSSLSWLDGFPVAAEISVAARGLSLSTCKTSLLPILKRPLLPLASDFVSVKILLAVHFVLQKIS